MHYVLLTELGQLHYIMVIYTKVHEILFNGYLVMAPDGNMNGWKDE